MVPLIPPTSIFNRNIRLRLMWQNMREDMDSKNAFAARGYWQAFQEVKKSVFGILKGSNSADVAEPDLSV